MVKNIVLHPYPKSDYIMIEYQMKREREIKKNEISQRRDQYRVQIDSLSCHNSLSHWQRIIKYITGQKKDNLSRFYQ